MANGVSDFFVNIFAPMIEMAGAQALDPVLDDLARSQPADYKAVMNAFHAIDLHLKPTLAKSNSKLLIGLFAAIEAEATANAAKNGVVFTD